MNRDFIRNIIIYFHNTKNISARALSLELGMSSEYINKLENGKINVSLKMIIEIAEMLKIDIKELFNDD